ncbi:lipopolysaccharide assembly protein LapA domain-containing protein [Streptomyces griseus]|uniref:lipopolysaccharide assembly protein LapA domain-containing protein n=1 Tax=Streptomyces griseus TaxID=1911 RepID=UPI0008406615|nr:LapA family protein [Streptomyces griseus]
MSRKDTPRRPSVAAHGRRGGERGSVLTPSRITVLVLAALAIVLIAENTQEISIRLVIPVVTMPQYLALLLMFVLGCLCGALLVYSRRSRRA